MESIYLLILVIATQGFVVEDVKALGNERKLAAPSIKELIAMDGPAIEVVWSPVDHEDVVGYKLKLWAAGKQDTNAQIAIVTGNPMLYESPPQIEVVTTGKNTRAVVNNLKLGTFYSIRVAAFTDKEEGPLSAASGIELHE